MEEIYRLHRENIYFFFLVADVTEILLASENLHNIPRAGWTLEAATGGEQFFFAD